MKSLLLIAITSLISSVTVAEEVKKEFPAEGLKTLKVANSEGRVRVTASSDDKARVTANKVDFGEGCKLTMEKSGDTLVIEAEDNSWFGSNNCEAHFDIQTPTGVDMEIATGSGDVEVSDIQGKLSYKTGSGSAKVQGDVEELVGRSGSGSLEVTGLRGRGDVKTGSGNILVSYKEAPKDGSLDIKTGSGNATLLVPEGTKLITDFRAGSGRVFNEVGDSPNADFKVSMKAGSGNLDIKKQ